MLNKIAEVKEEAAVLCKVARNFERLNGVTLLIAVQGKVNDKDSFEYEEITQEDKVTIKKIIVETTFSVTSKVVPVNGRVAKTGLKAVQYVGKEFVIKYVCA